MRLSTYAKTLNFLNAQRQLLQLNTKQREKRKQKKNITNGRRHDKKYIYFEFL